MLPLLIKETYAITTQGSSAFGELDETGWIDKEGKAFYSVEDAALYLIRLGAVLASSSVFYVGVWYSSHPIEDMHYGSSEERAYHISGISLEQEQLLYDLITKRSRLPI